MTDFAAHIETAPGEREAAFAEVDRQSLSSDREIRAATAEALAALGTPAQSEEALTRLARDSDVGVRYAAVAAAAGTPWRWRFRLLEQALHDEDLGIQALAADGLSYAGHRRVAPVLKRILSEKRLRFGALEGLYALHDTEVVEFARKIYGGFFTPFFDKAMAALILAREGDPAAREYLLAKLRKKFSEERNFVVSKLAEVDPERGRAAVEVIARMTEDASCETALLAMTKLDRSWWPLAQEAIGRNVESDPYAAGELLLGLFDIDWRRASAIADVHIERDNLLGSAARRIRLASALRSEFPQEVQLRCD